ncbi:MAG: hypothetical protein GEU28_14145 [Dehalococcoidia bacterium]|nr:hypothetical protein [Dehalococcoidia bacterium]
MAPNIVLMANVPCITPDIADVLRHELTHLVVEEALRGPFGSIPLWLNEGAAVYSQSTPGNYEPVVSDAIRRDELMTINQISSSPGDPSLVLLFYGQSWSIVNYLIEEYGEDAFGGLFRLYREGATSDRALEEVYGVGLVDLEDEWRESVGLEPRVRATAPDDDDDDDGVGAQATSPSDDDDGSAFAPIAIIAASTLGLLAVLGIVGVYLTRRPNQ